MNKRLLELLEDVQRHLSEKDIEAQRKGDLLESAKVSNLIGRLDFWILEEERMMEEDYKELIKNYE